MFIESYFQTATHLFEQYNLQMPLHLYLKEFFKNNKKFGSRDRKIIAELIYGIYRLGSLNQHQTLRERFIMGSFLSGRLPKLFFDKTDASLALYYEESFSVRKKIAIERGYSFELPFEISEGYSPEAFIEHLFAQPKVFIRIRKNAETILQVLKEQAIQFQKISATCLSFDANCKLDEILLNKEDYVIQDYASQQVGNYFHPTNDEKWWDCCAASGGKSILLLDKNKKIDLTVSDIRDTSLKNLNQRMHLYGYQSDYVSHLLDVSKDVSHKIKHSFDTILCDAPCSGSGTWARSPEQYYFFNEVKLNEFHSKQFDITSNILSKLRQNGSLIYITCSVFKHENENVIKEICQQHNMSCDEQTIINANEVGGDTMFLAVLKKGTNVTMKII